MDPAPDLSDLLLEWEERRAQGRPASPEELCRSRPELLAEFRRRAAALQALDPLLGGAGPQVTGSTTIDSVAARLEDGRLPTVPGFEVERELGRGGMGVVYLARHVGLDRRVALKMILAGYAGEVQHRRFRTEAEAIARLQHPNIIQVHEVGVGGSGPFFVLEYAAGGSLADRLDGSPLPPATAAGLVVPIARALQHAHERGIVHRDVKPHNVLLFGPPDVPLERCTVKVTDFGLAKKLDERGGQTQTGAIVGTPSYMAPEQARGDKEVGTAADVYALGAILYECLTGRPPFLAATALDTVLQVVSQEPVAPSRLNPHVPADLETITLAALHKEPPRRYPTAEALADDLGRFLAGDPVHARPVGPLGRAARWCRKRPAVAALGASVSLLLVAVAVVSSVAYWRTDRALAEEARQRRAAEVAQEETEKQRRIAEAERGRAVEASQKAVAEARQRRRLLYAADVRLAGQTWQSESASARQSDRLLAAWDGEGPEEDLREFAWRYLWGTIHDGPGVLRGHRGAVVQGAWREDGTLVTLDERGDLRRWDVAERRVLGHPLAEGGAEVRFAALSRDGAFAAVISSKGEVRLRDTLTGDTLHQRTFPFERGVLKLTPDGRRLVVCKAADGKAWLWDLSGDRPRVQALGRVPNAFGQALAALGPDGLTLAARSSTGIFSAVELTDLRAPQKKRSLEARHTILALAFSPDGSRVATGGINGEVILWDSETGKEVSRYAAHVRRVVCLAFSRDGARLASGDPDGNVAVNDPRDGRVVFRGKGHLGGVTFLSLSPDGKALASGSLDGTARVYALPQEKPQPVPRDPTDPDRVLGLASSADGKWLAFTQGDGVRLSDAEQAVARKRFAAGRRLMRVAFSPDSRSVAAGSLDGVVYRWDVESGKLAGRLESEERVPGQGIDRGVSALAYSRDGKLMAVGRGSPLTRWAKDVEHVVQVWDLGTAKVAAVLPHPNTCFSLAFSQDGKELLTGCFDGKIRSWYVSDWRPGRSWAAAGRVASLAVSAKGDLVAAGTDRGGVQAWDFASGREVLSAEEHQRIVIGLAFTPDGKTLASASEDRTLRLWHVASGRGLITLRGHESMVTALAVMPDGDTIASSDRAGVVRLWRAPPLARIDLRKGRLNDPVPRAQRTRGTGPPDHPVSAPRPASAPSAGRTCRTAR